MKDTIVSFQKKIESVVSKDRIVGNKTIKMALSFFFSSWLFSSMLVQASDDELAKRLDSVSHLINSEAAGRLFETYSGLTDAEKEAAQGFAHESQVLSERLASAQTSEEEAAALQDAKDFLRRAKEFYSGLRDQGRISGETHDFLSQVAAALRDLWHWLFESANPELPSGFLPLFGILLGGLLFWIKRMFFAKE